MSNTPSWEVVRTLGSGSYGTVAQVVCRHNGQDTLMAVKDLHQHMVNDATAKARLQREISVMKTLAGKYERGNFIPIFGERQVDGETCGFVMPFYVNGSLAYQLKQRGLLSPIHALRMLSTIAYKLELAHELNIYHGDLKPDNILMSDDFKPLISDWGMAWIPNDLDLTATGGFTPGTPN